MRLAASVSGCSTDRCCLAQEGEPGVKGNSKAGRVVPPPKGTRGRSPTALEQGEQSRPRARSKFSHAPVMAR